MSGIVPKALEWGMEEAEFSWVLESNLVLAREPGEGRRQANENLPYLRLASGKVALRHQDRREAA